MALRRRAARPRTRARSPSQREELDVRYARGDLTPDDYVQARSELHVCAEDCKWVCAAARISADPPMDAS